MMNNDSPYKDTCKLLGQWLKESADHLKKVASALSKETKILIDEARKDFKASKKDKKQP